MLELIYPMGSVLLSWLLLFLLFSGAGLLVLRAIGQPVATGWLWLDGFWLGWALTLAVAQLWHVAFPVNETLLLALAIIAALSLVSRRQSLGPILVRLATHRAFLLLFALLALWMSNRALGMPIAFDTGYRDIQIVLWLDAYPIVPGLGNLFSSFAFNHSVYLYDALLDVAIWSGRSYHIATGLLLMVYLAFALNAALTVLRSRADEGLRWSRLFAALTIPFFLYQTVSFSGISHFLTDTVIELIGFLTLVYLLDFLQYWRAGCRSHDYLVYRLALIVLTGFTVKQSFAVFGLASALFALVIWLRRGGLRAGAGKMPRLVVPICGVALALMLPWMARGVVTSGYVAFPQSIGRFELDWTIPAEEIETRQMKLATNTRIRDGDPAVVLASWDWLGPWLREFASNVFSNVLPISLTLVALGFCVVARRHKRARRASPLSWWLFAPMTVMLLFWFFSAPEDKYVRYVFWGFAALSITKAVLDWEWVAWRRRLLAISAVLLLCLAYIAFLVLRQDAIFLPAGPEDGFHAHFLPTYDELQIEEGLTVNVPTGIYQCWQIPLPCSPLPPAGLSARAPGELRHGFRIAPQREAG